MTPAMPKVLADSIPPECQQALFVVSPERMSVRAWMWLLERRDEKEPWNAKAGPMPVVLGRQGLAWGCGDYTPSAPAGWPEKKEGDGCSPAGVFPITFAFGSESQDANHWIKLPYRRATPHLRGVDDPQSKYYNQVVDETQVTPDWKSSEDMLREDGLYRWGAFVAHNPRGEPFRGSCIFLHVWSGPNRGTAGCTAMPEPVLRQVLAWLDPRKKPCLVQIAKED